MLRRRCTGMTKYKLTYDETRIIIMSLIELKNQLVREGRYTDAVDDLLIKFMEAVDVLTLAFSLAEEDKSYALTALIANSGRDDVYRMFLQSFTENSGRCEVRYILVGLPDELN
jgi:hypothetical protein